MQKEVLDLGKAASTQYLALEVSQMWKAWWKCWLLVIWYMQILQAATHWERLKQSSIWALELQLCQVSWLNVLGKCLFVIISWSLPTYSDIYTFKSQRRLVNRSWQATEQQCQKAQCKPKKDETLVQIMSTCRPICNCSTHIVRTKAACYSTPKWTDIYMTRLKETPEANHLRLKLNLQDELQCFSCSCNWPKSSCDSTENRDRE